MHGKSLARSKVRERFAVALIAGHLKVENIVAPKRLSSGDPLDLIKCKLGDRSTCQIM